MHQPVVGSIALTGSLACSWNPFLKLKQSHSTCQAAHGILVLEDDVASTEYRRPLRVIPRGESMQNKGVNTTSACCPRYPTIIRRPRIPRGDITSPDATITANTLLWVHISHKVNPGGPHENALFYCRRIQSRMFAGGQRVSVNPRSHNSVLTEHKQFSGRRPATGPWRLQLGLQSSTLMQPVVT